jgi:hypothetical protein
MSSLATVDPAVAVEDDIPDDIFAGLPDHANTHVPSASPWQIQSVTETQEDDIMATLPSLPSLEGLATRLADVNHAIDAARAEADSLKNELQQKAKALRAMAEALESI